MLLTVASVQAQTATTISVETSSSLTVGNDANVWVTLSAEINAIATLTVTNSDNSYNETFNVGLVGGNGFFVVPNLPAGTYSITASFAGNEQYDASTSAAKTLQVSKETTALALSLVDESIYVGDFTGFIVKLQNPNDFDLDNNPKTISINTIATVRLTDKDTFNDATDKVYIVGLVNGQYGYIGEEDGNLSPKDCQNALTDFPAGTYKLKASFVGDDLYVGSKSDVVTLTVSKIATTLTVADITPINAGEDAIVALTATPTDYTGYATVTVGSNSYKVAIVNGTGSCIIPNLAEGTHDVTASIAEDDKYLGSTDTKQVTVNEGNPIVESNSVATVTVTPTDYTGNVTVTIDGENYNVAVINGTGKVVLPQLAAGTYAISASIAEDGKYAASSNEEAQIVSVPGVTFPFATGQTWATWCDDWAWKKPTGVTAYTVSAVSGGTVTIAEVEGDNIPSHTPLLLKKTGDAVTPTKVITGTGTDALVSTTATGATFYGNASDTKITEGYNYAYGSSYGLYNGEFVLIDTDNGIAANRCLLNVGNGQNAPVLTIGTETTSLVSIEFATPHSQRENGQLIIDNDVWYTLDGRKLEGMPTKKGIYINGGRKVVVR
jgi:hypothetical protein